MKKIIYILFITVAFLLNGCSDKPSVSKSKPQRPIKAKQTVKKVKPKPPVVSKPYVPPAKKEFHLDTDSDVIFLADLGVGFYPNFFSVYSYVYIKSSH